MLKKSPFHRTFAAGLKALLLALLALTVSLGPVRAQTRPEPRREQLLNGLRVRLWYRPSDPNILLKLRIHSGAIFDLAGKAGMMALMSDALFPDPATRDYFTQELGGRLEVESDYDSINITMLARATEFERIVELLRNAVAGPPPEAETFNSLRAARIKLSREMQVSPSLLADRAIAARLFGDYPYGRASTGTPDTLAHIDRPDLMLARDRFLNANNATLVLVGGVQEQRALRALRQLLGSWRRSDALVPATFRQPDAPDSRTLILDLPGAPAAEVRLATRGLARSDTDAATAQLLAIIARDRWQAAMPELSKAPFFVRHEAHLLTGMFVMGATVNSSQASTAFATARDVLKSLAASPPSSSELEKARNEALALLSKQLDDASGLANLWLDMESFKLAGADEQLRSLNRATAADLQRVAAKLFRDAPTAAIALGSAAQLSAELQRTGKIEVFGAPTPTETPAQPAPSRTP